MLTAKEAAEVEAELERSLPWAIAAAARMVARASGYERHTQERAMKKRVYKNAAKAQRRAAKKNRTPAWANARAIRAVYERARQMTEASGLEHHVDHIYPLQGRLVSGLHVENNLQVLPGPENCRKNNRYEP